MKARREIGKQNVHTVITGRSSGGLPAAEQLSKEHQSNIHHSGLAGPPAQLQGIARGGREQR